MSSWRQTWALTAREFSERARSRVFIMFTVFTVGLVMAVLTVVAFVESGTDTASIGITPGTDPELPADLRSQGTTLGWNVEVHSYPDQATARRALGDGEVDVVYTGTSVVWLHERSTTIDAIISRAAATEHFRQAAADLGVSESELQQVLTPPAPDVSILDPPDRDLEARRVAALIGLILMYMSILVFGQWVAMGITEEKQSRVVEVVLSRVEPWQVLVGKVVGIGALGLAQVVVLGGSVWLTAGLVDIADVSVAGLGARLLASVVWWFLLGYTMFAIVYAALGATVSRQEDLQSALLLPALLIVPGLLIAQLAQDNPDTPLVVAASLVPLWAPMVMQVRTAVSDVEWWQVAIANLAVGITALGAIRIGARIYRGAILRLGAKVRLRDAWHSSV